MKILFLSLGTGMDYQCDTILTGLKLLFGSDVVDANKAFHLYDTYPENKLSKLYGKGFTLSKVIEDLPVDRDDIDRKIATNYFDLVIYGSIWRYSKKLELVIKHYSREKIIVIDGEEPPNPVLHPSHLYTTYFKRELYNSYEGVNTIQFSLPDCKFNTIDVVKKKKVASITPLDKSTYIYTNEKDYYNDYAESLFAITCRKGGWDCMRHYEILGNKCIPLFLNLKGCPEQTLTVFPKIKLQEIYKTIEITNNTLKLHNPIDYYLEEIANLVTFTKNNLTCSQYVLNHFLKKIKL